MFDTKRKIAVGLVIAMFGAIWFANRQAINTIENSEIPRANYDAPYEGDRRETMTFPDARPGTEALNPEYIPNEF